LKESNQQELFQLINLASALILTINLTRCPIVSKLALAASLLYALIAGAGEAAYPERPLRLVVPSAPEIPTIAESGVPGYEAYNWSGLLAPAGTPRAIVMQLHAAVLLALQDPVVRKRFIDNGADATPGVSPEAFGAFMQAELVKWTRLIRDAGIRPQ